MMTDWAARLGQRLQVTGDRREQALDRDVGEFEGFLAGIETCQPQQVLDEPLHARRMPRDDLEEARRLGFVFRSVEQRLHVAADRRQRRAQFVRHVGDEVPPDAVGPSQVGDVVQHEHRAAAAWRDRR